MVLYYCHVISLVSKCLHLAFEESGDAYSTMEQGTGRENDFTRPSIRLRWPR